MGQFVYYRSPSNFTVVCYTASKTIADKYNLLLRVAKFRFKNDVVLARVYEQNNVLVVQCSKLDSMGKVSGREPGALSTYTIIAVTSVVTSKGQRKAQHL